MDDKEQRIFEHYKKRIEKGMFDEYDIYAFLILIRRHIKAGEKGKYKYISEIANLIAHRERKQGVIMECIVAAIDNNYQLETDNSQVQGYKGMRNEEWEQEWFEFGIEFSVLLSKKIIDEITLCVYSLVQHSCYDDGKGHVGIVEVCQTSGKALALVTKEMKRGASYVCFSSFGKFDFVREVSAGLLRKAIETERVNGRLRLKDEDGYIL